MKLYLFTDENPISKNSYRRENIITILEKIAETTDTTDLVVGVYLLADRHSSEGHMITSWLSPEDFHNTGLRGWSFTCSFRTPDDLPPRFKLIRMQMGLLQRYKRNITAMYGWQMRFENFTDNLAYLFAHELHHFRRYHLGLHPGEGEQSACKWGLYRATESGFRVKGTQIARRIPKRIAEKKLRIRTERNPELLRRVRMSAAYLSPEDLKDLANWAYKRSREAEILLHQRDVETHNKRLRNLANGTIVKITGPDGKWRRYTGLLAIKIRTLKSNSKRMAIKTPDGRELYWPMQWLEVIE